MLLSFFLALGTLVRSRAIRDLAYGPFSRQRLDVHVPLGADGEEPVVVLLHGASRRLGVNGQVLAARGFVVVAPKLDTYAPRAVQDAAAACAWAEDHAADHGGDPSRLFVFGDAEGAAVAAALALDPEWLAVAGVKTPLRGVVGLCGVYDCAGLESLAQARPDATPILLIAGRDDQDQASRAASRLAGALRAAGGQVTEIRHPGFNRGRKGLRGLVCPIRLSRMALQEAERFIRLLSLVPRET